MSGLKETFRSLEFSGTGVTRNILAWSKNFLMKFFVRARGQKLSFRIRVRTRAGIGSDDVWCCQDCSKERWTLTLGSRANILIVTNESWCSEAECLWLCLTRESLLTRVSLRKSMRDFCWGYGLLSCDRCHAKVGGPSNWCQTVAAAAEFLRNWSQVSGMIWSRAVWLWPAPVLQLCPSQNLNHKTVRDERETNRSRAVRQGSHLSPASDTGPGRCRQYLDTRRLDTISNTTRFFSAPLRVLDVKCIVYEWLPGCQARCPDYQLRARGDGRAGRAEPRKQTQPGIGDTGHNARPDGGN